MPHGPTRDVDLPTDVLCGHCSHNADCELAAQRLVKCDMYLPGVNSEAVYSGHLYHLDNPSQDDSAPCNSCKLSEEGVCALAGTVPAGYGCIYHQKNAERRPISELVQSAEAEIEAILQDLSNDLIEEGLVLSDARGEIVTHTPVGGVADNQIVVFKVEVRRA